MSEQSTYAKRFTVPGVGFLPAIGQIEPIEIASELTFRGCDERAFELVVACPSPRSSLCTWVLSWLLV